MAAFHLRLLLRKLVRSIPNLGRVSSSSVPHNLPGRPSGGPGVSLWGSFHLHLISLIQQTQGYWGCPFLLEPVLITVSPRSFARLSKSGVAVQEQGRLFRPLALCCSPSAVTVLQPRTIRKHVNEHSCILTKLYLQEQTVGSMWPTGCRSWSSTGLVELSALSHAGRSRFYPQEGL